MVTKLKLSTATPLLMVLTKATDSAAQPTNKLARPPKPLNKATISGIEVIATFLETTAPTRAPTTKPTAINSKLRIC